MARNNRDRLIKTFMSRNRRNPPPGYRPQKQGTKPAGIPGYRPSPTGGENAVFSRSTSSRKKPPRQNFGVTGAIPGFGQVRDSRNAAKIAEAQARHDTTTRPRYGAQRAPYRPGERFKRKNPYKYQRGDAARPHRPRLD